MAAQIVQFLLNMLSVVIMARLLSPVEYGLVAMVAPVTGFIGIFKDLGLSAATVQVDEINHEQVSTLFWLNFAISIGLALLCLLLGPAVGRFYHDARTVWIMWAMAGSFLLSGLTGQHNAILKRQMRFGVIAMISLSSAVITAATGILTAWLGWGYWSLVAMTLGGNLANCVAVWVASSWRPSKIRRGAGVRELVRFGSFLTISQTANYISGNIDKIIIGRAMGPGPLGLYNRAFQLLMMPLDQVFGPVSGVFLVLLSRLNGDPERYRNAVRKIGDVLIMVITPLAAISIVLSSEIVAVFLGDAWMQVVPIFRVLAIMALILPMSYLGAIILQSSGRTDIMMKWAPISMVISVVSILVGMHWGLIGIATVWVAGAVVVRTPAFYLVISRSTHITFGHMMTPLLFYALPFVLLLLGGWELRTLLHFSRPIWTLLIDGSILSVGYAAFLCSIGKHTIIMQLMRRGSAVLT